jgi:hypothetical protein
MKRIIDGPGGSETPLQDHIGLATETVVGRVTKALSATKRPGRPCLVGAAKELYRTNPVQFIQDWRPRGCSTAGLMFES